MSDDFNNKLNNVQNNNKDEKREKAAKISDAVGELSEKIVSDTDSKRKTPSADTEKPVFTSAAGLWGAKRIWIPAVSAAACGAIVLGVLFGSGILRNDISGGIDVHTLANNEQDLSGNPIQNSDDGSQNGNPSMGGTNGEPVGTDNADTDMESSGGYGEDSQDKNGGSGNSTGEFAFSTETTTPEQIAMPSTEPIGTTAGTDSQAAETLSTVQEPGAFNLSQYVEVLGLAEYPYSVSYISGNMSPEEFNNRYQKWWDERALRIDIGKKVDTNALTEFNKKTSSVFLTDSNEKNRVYSPANIYLSLAVLAELADGESRQQILELAGFDNIEALREQSSALWKSTYRNDGICSTVLANSLWLQNGIDVDNDTVNKVADEYFASIFRGDMGSEETLTALKEWLDYQTGGLLKDSINNLELSPSTVMTLCSTVYFNAKWRDEFVKEKNDFRIFHSPYGDTESEFMNTTLYDHGFFRGEDYAAASLRFDVAGGSMWFILPDEDKTVDDVLESGEYLEMLDNLSGWENYLSQCDINLSVPKFDVSSDLNLIEGLKTIGIEDIFNIDKADFSPLVKDLKEVFIGKAEHAARVVIDEQGCEAAAYTVLPAAMGGGSPDYEDIDFVLDRPFVFVITSETDSVLFVGTVYDVG